MPELPEVERAASIFRNIAQDRLIERVDTTKDDIVYSGISHEQFADTLTGRRVTGVGRYGKVFYITLDGSGMMPVLHLGMTGMVLIKGQEPMYYRRKFAGAEVWPPQFMKFILHIEATPTAAEAEIAFIDPRRLGRIRLCASPLTELPISSLGFDPLLSMPSQEDFSASVRKRSCAIKALLLDQSFSAGVGNWIADEVLYQSRVHPEQRANGLTDGQLELLHNKIVDVCRKAVDVNADSFQFPDDWLFKHRWNKGKKAKCTLLLPSGEPATIKWIKVGGRTSAYVPELQQLVKKEAMNISPQTIFSDGELSPLSGDEVVTPVTGTPLKRKASGSVNHSARRTDQSSSKRVRTFTLKGTDVVEDSSEMEPSPSRCSRRKSGGLAT